MQHVMANALRGSVAIIRKGEEDDPIGIVTKSLEDLQKAVDDRLKKVEDDKELKALQDRLAELEKKANRPAGGGNTDEQAGIERKALSSFVRTGSDMEIKACPSKSTSAVQSGIIEAPLTGDGYAALQARLTAKSPKGSRRKSKPERGNVISMGRQRG